MAFGAVHAERGVVFSHLPDLGCGQAWEAVWKIRLPTPLTCDECNHQMFAKVSHSGLRFFAHAPVAPHCALAIETGTELSQSYGLGCILVGIARLRIS
jgi:hypothetical protein